MSWHRAVGLILSSIVTVGVQVAEFPFPSLTVRVTVFPPKLLQSKLNISSDKKTEPQLSVLLLSTSDGAIVTFPLASNCAVMS